MTIFFYKGLTRNPEIGNTPVWVLPNIWRLGRVMDTKFATNAANKMLLNAAKFQGYSFYCFWEIIKRKPTGGGSKITPSPPRLGLRVNKTEKTKDDVSFPHVNFLPVILPITAKNWLFWAIRLVKCWLCCFWAICRRLSCSSYSFLSWF